MIPAHQRSADTQWCKWIVSLPTREDRNGHTWMVYPHPHQDGGLPSGWRVVSTWADYRAGTDMVLVQCATGGWMRVMHTRAENRSTRTTVIHPSLPAVYNALSVFAVLDAEHTQMGRDVQGAVAGVDAESVDVTEC